MNDWWIPIEKALQNGKWQAALCQLHRLPPDHTGRVEFYKLVSCAYIQAGRWDEVSLMAGSGAQRFPDEPVLWECWAWAEYIQGAPAVAIRILEFAFEKFPHRESMVYMMACLYAAIHRHAKAESCLSLAKRLSADPAAFIAKAARQKELSGLWAAHELAFAA